KRRLDNPHDYVRIEIAAALQRDIPVVPILLEGTKIPRPDQLPDDIRELSLRNGLDIRLASFHDDCNRLIRGLKQQLDVRGAQSQADAPSQNERPKDAPPKEAPPEKTQAQIGAGILAIVGGIGALLSFTVLVTVWSLLGGISRTGVDLLYG